VKRSTGSRSRCPASGVIVGHSDEGVPKWSRTPLASFSYWKYLKRRGGSVKCRRLLYVIGTRPEVVRSARILEELKQEVGLEVVLLNTQQHYDANMMSDLWDELGIPVAAHTLPRFDANPAIRAGQMIESIARLLSSESFDAIAVYGDTDSSLAAAIAGAKAAVPIIHVEAGCRSGDLRMQEELNRRLIDHLSTLLLAVSENCANHLLQENVTGSVVVTGDPQYDVFAKFAPQPGNTLERDHKAFVTIHRSENIDDRRFLPAFLDMLGQLSRARGLQFVWPVHPRAREQLTNETGEWGSYEGIVFVEPMSYEETMSELSSSQLCITDSGGLQKEAFWLQVPCVTMRPCTEWVETVSLGANRLIPNLEDFAVATGDALDVREVVHWRPDPYGGIGSSHRVATAISAWFMASA
jgi:UDP-GlcNAc3NAcA epimerase